MDEIKRIMVSVPEQMLADIDRFAASGRQSRSEFVREAMDAYLSGRRHQALLESMKRGYEEMAAINLSLAEDGLCMEGPTGELGW